MPVLGRAASAVNAEIIADEVLKEAAREDVSTILLIAYSKGLPDSLEAVELLRSRGTLPAKLHGLVSVAGVVLGTPLADRHGPVYEMVGVLVTPLACSRSQGGELASLTSLTRSHWLAAHDVPDGIRLYSVVAHDARQNIAPGLRAMYDELSLVDPRNDGQVIAARSVLPRSTLLAEVRSDHWKFLLPLSSHPSVLVRTMASSDEFPRVGSDCRPSDLRDSFSSVARSQRSKSSISGRDRARRTINLSFGGLPRISASIT